MPNHQMRKFTVEIFLRNNPTRVVRCEVVADCALVAIMAALKLVLLPSEEDLIQSITVEDPHEHHTND